MAIGTATASDRYEVFQDKRWWASQVGYVLENRKYQGAVEYLFRRGGTEAHVLRRG